MTPYSNKDVYQEVAKCIGIQWKQIEEKVDGSSLWS